MRKLSVFVIAALLLTGCKKLGTFTITGSTEFTVPALTPIGVFSVPVQTSSQSSFQAQGTDAKHLKEVHLEKISLTITDPPSGNFNFLDKVHIYISASGVAEQEVAFLDPIPQNGSVTIDLNTTGIELVEYIKQETYNLRISTTTNQIINQDVTMKADMTFRVKAKLL
jgi:hypothetical protein